MLTLTRHCTFLDTYSVYIHELNVCLRCKVDHLKRFITRFIFENYCRSLFFVLKLITLEISSLGHQVLFLRLGCLFSKKLVSEIDNYIIVAFEHLLLLLFLVFFFIVTILRVINRTNFGSSTRYILKFLLFLCLIGGHHTKINRCIFTFLGTRRLFFLRFLIFNYYGNVGILSTTYLSMLLRQVS